jgi:hypothetical protein
MKKTAWTHFIPTVGTIAYTSAVGLFSPAAYADFFIHSWENHHTKSKLFDVGADLTWYHTSTNFDSNGTSFSPAGLDSYQRVLLDLSAVAGLTQKLSVYGRLSWEMSKVDSTNTAAFVGTAYGLGDQTLGVNYRVYERPHQASIDLQGQIDFPAYSAAVAPANGTIPTNAPNLGDASVDLTGGAFITYMISEKAENDARFVGGLGYTYRSNSFSAALPWNAAFALVPRREGLVAQFGAFGNQSLNTDSHPNNAIFLNTSTGSLGTGGSYITNAIDPSHATLRGELGWRTQNDLQFTGTIAQTVWGHEAPNGLTLTLGFLTHFGGEQASSSEDPAFQSPLTYGHSNSGYVNYDGLEAKVLRANDRFNLVKIDKGADHGVQAGDTFDIFVTNPDGSAGFAVARGRVTSVKGGEAAIRIEEYFREVWIEEGFTARRPIH